MVLQQIVVLKLAALWTHKSGILLTERRANHSRLLEIFILPAIVQYCGLS